MAEQEFLLNTYRCQFHVDTEVVPGGCVAFETQRTLSQLAELVKAKTNDRRGGLSPLAVDDQVSAAAQARAQAQAKADDWVHGFDYRPWLEPEWGVWVAVRSVSWSTGIIGLTPESISKQLLDFGEGGVEKLRCEWCTHLGVGLAEHGGRTYTNLILAGARPSASAIAAAENEMAALVNQLRQELGLGNLAIREGVAAVARQWSQTMAVEQRFRHNPSFVRQYPPGWTAAAENIAMVPLSNSISEAVQHSFRNLADSPGHYANMADPDLTHIGIGIEVRVNGLWVTQNFATYPATTTIDDDPQPGGGDSAVTLRQTDVDAVYEGKCNFSCAWQAVTVTGFQPGTYPVKCWSHNTPNRTPIEYQIGNPYTVTVGPDGTGSNSEVCWNGWYQDVADYSANVYVTVGNVKSNTITLRRPRS
ncbi:CAP domain-containing protein [Candidatus Poriferisocius sp.]|uniref:CAP domain-containing protein n=1 Tax=Candidatus Poriferisocius sp. TaxID=3101276 RepID=UPI003B017731